MVHHIEKPVEVGFQNVKYREVPSPAAMPDRTWFYDAARQNLRVRVRAKAAQDCIINLAW